MRVADLGEFGLLDILEVGAVQLPDGWLGPGDDCALLSCTEGVLVSTDLLVEKVHFKTDTTTPEALGYKSLATNVSDIASMGGAPLGYTIGLTLPPATQVAWVRSLYAGLAECGDEYGCPLIGGDTSAGSIVVISITILGRPPLAGAVKRSATNVDDDLWVSGHPGMSRLGLELLEGGADVEGGTPVQSLVRAHIRPKPRAILGRELGERKIATAMIDISDGLLKDLGHIAERSGVGFSLKTELLPVHSDLAGVAMSLGVSPLPYVLAGGEDYELLFTARCDDREKVLETAEACRTPVARIGVADSGSGVRGDWPAGLLSDAGFEHFSDRSKR